MGPVHVAVNGSKNDQRVFGRGGDQAADGAIGGLSVGIIAGQFAAGLGFDLTAQGTLAGKMISRGSGASTPAAGA